MKIGYKLNDGNYFIIEIDIAEINKLYIHEEIVPSILSRVKNSLRTFGYQNDPIMIDEKTGVILDGMHRYASIKSLGYDYILVAKVNYRDPHILIRNWYRTFPSNKVDNLKENLVDTLNKRGIHYELVPEIVRNWKTNWLTKIFLPQRETLIIKDNGDVLEKYRKIKGIEEILEAITGSKPNYKPEEHALNTLESYNKDIIVATPPITKDDVIKYALERKVFPPKSTRHIFPARPLFASIPLKILKSASKNEDIEEKRSLLEKILYQKMLVRVRGKIQVDRYYEEQALFIFV